MKIGIINYNACNLASIYFSLYRLGYDPILINNKNKIKKIDKLIIPGVGAAKSCLDYLKENSLFDEIKIFLKSGKPILGICLGLQIFSKKLHEHGISQGFGFIDAEVVPFKKRKKFNIGWSILKVNEDLDFIKPFSEKSFYFCHSFYLKFNDSLDKKYCKGIIDFEEVVPSLIIKKNFMGVQFHPEKSQRNGNKLLKLFLNWKPKLNV